MILDTARLGWVKERMERQQVKAERANDSMWSLAVKGREQGKLEVNVKLRVFIDF